MIPTGSALSLRPTWEDLGASHDPGVAEIHILVLAKNVSKLSLSILTNLGMRSRLYLFPCVFSILTTLSQNEFILPFRNTFSEKLKEQLSKKTNFLKNADCIK